jgi:transcriptional regulator with XRE-family HTH domain
MTKTAANRLLGGRIRAARMAAGLTMPQLAKKVGMATTSIAQIETGRARPGRDKAELIATATGVDVAILCPAELLDRPLIQQGPPGSSRSVEYFWRRVDKRGADECWPWTGSLNGKGYGHVTFRSKGEGAHRVAYELSVKPIPDGLEIDHTCHDPKVCRAGSDCPHRRCCNPAHLEPVTHAVNVKRSARGGREPSRRRRGQGWARGRKQKSNPGLTADQRFGLYLSSARKKAGLTQAELGEMVGLVDSSVCLIESGTRRPSATRRAAFISALGIDSQDLLGFINSRQAPEPELLFDLEAVS